MNKKILLGTVAGGVVFFLLGWLIYGVFLMDFMKENMVQYEGLIKDPPGMWGYAVSNLAWAFLVSYIFVKWANISTINRGFTAGMIISFPIILGIDIVNYAEMNLLNETMLIVDIIIGTIMGGIMGAVVGWVVGMGKKQAA